MMVDMNNMQGTNNMEEIAESIYTDQEYDNSSDRNRRHAGGGGPGGSKVNKVQQDLQSVKDS